MARGLTGPLTVRRYREKLLGSKMIRMGLDDTDLRVLERKSSIRIAWKHMPVVRGSKGNLDLPFDDIGLVRVAFPPYSLALRRSCRSKPPC